MALFWRCSDNAGIKRLLLTADSSAAGALQWAGLGNLVIAIERRLVWGPLPSAAELMAFFEPMTTQAQARHWLSDTPSWRLERSAVTGRGLIELVSECQSAELWMGPEPNAQLILIWLLDHCAGQEAAAQKLLICPLEFNVGAADPGQLAQFDPPLIRLTEDHFELSRRAWRAYREPTPQACFDLLKADLSPLPQLACCLRSLLEELPSVRCGLGATETRILQLVAPGDVPAFDVLRAHPMHNERGVFAYWELGALLDGLARCPEPAIAGLAEGPFSLDMRKDESRYARYQQSRLSLTDLGKAVLAGEEDFCRHNPIRR